MMLVFVSLHFIYPFPKQSRVFMTHRKKPFENTVGKGENAGNQHFLFFSTMFSIIQEKNLAILATSKLSSAKCFQFEQG